MKEKVFQDMKEKMDKAIEAHKKELNRLRTGRADLPRPYRSPLFLLAPLVYALAAVTVVVSTLWTAEPRLKYTGLAIIAVGALLYRPWRWMVGRAAT